MAGGVSGHEISIVSREMTSTTSSGFSHAAGFYFYIEFKGREKNEHHNKKDFTVVIC